MATTGTHRPTRARAPTARPPAEVGTAAARPDRTPVAADRRVSAAIAALRHFHAIGKASLKQYGEKLTAEQQMSQADRRRIDARLLYKARAFAKTYDDAALNRLCNLCRQNGAALGVTALSCLLGLKPPHREALIGRAIKEGWTRKTAEAEVRRQSGRRRKSGAGRHRRMPKTSADACYTLLQACENWRSLAEVLGAAEGKAKLAKEVRVAMESMAAQAKRLQDMLEQRHVR